MRARRADLEVVPSAQHHGKGLLAWSALGRGVLGGRYRHGTPKDSRGGSDRLSWFVQPYLTRKSNAVVEAIVKAADGLGATVPQIALAWVRDAPVVASALVGPRTTAPLAALLGAGEGRLAPVLHAALAESTGGPNLAREEA